ncbi:MAG TPA: hypothetical protein VE344_09965 [Methylomirabilota bacterium]|nr:hypothetical protein [Methylomirabilota bacterium]
MIDPVKITDAPPAARVMRIHIEYDDGSSDTAELHQISPIMLYGLTRKRQDKVIAQGAYTNGAVAGIFFKTAITSFWTDYGIPDMEVAGLLKYWLDSQKNVCK